MPRITPLAIVFALAGVSLSGADYRDISRTVTLSSRGALDLRTFRGSIEISTWDRPEVEVKARIGPAGGSAADRRRFDGTDVRIDSAPDWLHIATVYPNSCCGFVTGTNPDVAYTIRMPRTARLSIRDQRSDIEISDLAAALDIDTHRGTVRVERLEGPLTLITHRGDARVDFASFHGDSLVETHRGSIQLLLPRDSRFDVHAAPARRGWIESDFPVLAHLAGGPGLNLNGRVNGGGPTLQLLNARGAIQLRSK
ncbi:MAG TPA: DUF4097 family beta strand repeat-containing protein [Bryobacteraceae bacterium]|nr:DUF4097 family beta strand repeat-containing protein [Bryobacteraceae bacterium]